MGGRSRLRGSRLRFGGGTRLRCGGRAGEQGFDLRQAPLCLLAQGVTGGGDFDDHLVQLGSVVRVTVQQGGDRRHSLLVVQQDHEKLLPKGRLEFGQGALVILLGAKAADHLEAALIGLAFGQTHIDQSAQQGFARAALVDLGEQFGLAMGDQGQVVRFLTGTTARRGVGCLHAHQGLQPGLAVDIEKELFSQRVPPLAVGFQALNDQV